MMIQRSPELSRLVIIGGIALRKALFAIADEIKKGRKRRSASKYRNVSNPYPIHAHF